MKIFSSSLDYLHVSSEGGGEELNIFSFKDFLRQSCSLFCQHHYGGLAISFASQSQLKASNCLITNKHFLLFLHL